MILEEVSSSLYQEVIREPYHIFGGAAFNILQESKAEQVHYFLFKDSRYRLGLIAGQLQQELVSPFAAPFGGFTPVYNDIKIQAIEEAVDLLQAWAIKKGIHKIKFILPPPVYNESYLTKSLNVLYRKNFVVETLELNFYFDLLKFTPDYRQTIWRNASKNLTIALDSQLAFFRCTTQEEKENAYRVLSLNRSLQGRSLRMSWEQVKATTEIIPADFFVVTTAEGQSAAAAIVYRVAPAIAQVIYWGDLPEYQPMKTMNFLSFKIFEYYKEQNFRIVDIGGASENSVPNYGLCEFKESLGCDIQPKITFVKEME